MLVKKNAGSKKVSCNITTKLVQTIYLNQIISKFIEKHDETENKIWWDILSTGSLKINVIFNTPSRSCQKNFVGLIWGKLYSLVQEIFKFQETTWKVHVLIIVVRIHWKLSIRKIIFQISQKWKSCLCAYLFICLLAYLLAFILIYLLTFLLASLLASLLVWFLLICSLADLLSCLFAACLHAFLLSCFLPSLVPVGKYTQCQLIWD